MQQRQVILKISSVSLKQSLKLIIQQAEVPISHLTLDQESSYDSQTSHSLEEPSNFSGKYFQLPLVNLPILSTTNSTQPNHTSLPAPKIIIHSGKHNKEKRTDNACNYKQRFSKLIRKNYGASVNWAHYKNTRICGSLRPCIRVHMSFCTLQGGEFLNLRREFESKSYNRLGNRNCKCSLLRNQHVSPSM